MVYLVKFSPCNAKSLKLIRQKKIKFSTPYEFNDFNELSYMCENIVDEGKFNEFYKKKFKWRSFKKQFYTDSMYIREEIKNILEKVKKYKRNPDAIDEEYKKRILENMVFNSVGIFCASSVDVFDDDAAQLMFAHYAEDCTGIALIYERDESSTRKLHKITYINNNSIADQSEGAPFEWLNGIFESMAPFNKKSEKWDYEVEYRLFDTPDKHPAGNYGLELKAILYTSRLTDKNLDKLRKLNTKNFDGKLSLEEIYSCRSEQYTKFALAAGGGDILQLIRSFN